jgi:hypothetical protein
MKYLKVSIILIIIIFIMLLLVMLEKHYQPLICYYIICFMLGWNFRSICKKFIN